MPEQDKELVKTEETNADFKRVAAPTEFHDGFSLRTIIGAFFVGFLMMPAAIYIGLVVGQGLGSAAQWVTIILFMEIVRRSFGTLKRQELYLLYYMAGSLTSMAGGVMISGGPFGWLVWNQYVLNSPSAAGFGIVEALKAEGVRWIAPFPGSEALMKRTFFHADWWPAIAVMLITNLLGRFTWFGLGYIVFRITSDLEKLPFPMAPIAAQGATALAEVSGKKETWRWRLFSIGAVIGVVFGFIYVLIPAVTGVFLKEPLQLLPIPFIDLCRNTEGFMPATPNGIDTNLGTILVGFVIPFPIILGSFISSVICQMVANPILHVNGILKTWTKGMGLIQTNLSNYVDFWMSIQIGIGVAVAILGFMAIFKSFSKKQKIQGSLKPVPGRGDIPLWIAALSWFASTLGIVIICHKLVPTFPIWILVLFGFVLTPIFSYVSARMTGMVGSGVGFPYLREGVFILSGYKGAGIWWAPFPNYDFGGCAQMFREVELTGTKITSIIKVEFFMFPLLMVCSLIFWSFLWKLGPIPSALYPYAAKFWPFNATVGCLWSSSTIEGGAKWLLEAIKLKWILGGGFSAMGLYLILNTWLRLPTLFYYGLVGGALALPMSTVPMLIGGLLRKYVFEKRFGAKTWDAYAPVLVAGFFCGMGLMGMGGVAVALISKAVYQLPF